MKKFLNKVDGITVACTLIMAALVVVGILAICGVFGGNTSSVVRWNTDPLNMASPIHW